jgi:TrmH family RNA methyltransferase
MTAAADSGKVTGIMGHAKITSASNQRIRDAVRIRERKEKFGHDFFLVEGPHLVETAIRAGADIKEVFISEAFLAGKEHQGLLRLIAGYTGEILEVTEQVLGKITDTETPQGVVAVAEYGQWKLEDLAVSGRDLIVILDGIQDPGNLGAIIRTADAAGAGAVVLLPATCDALMPKAVRATAGSIFHVPVLRAGYDAVLAWLEEKEIPLAVTAADASQDLFLTDLSGPVAIAFGNEARGVSSRLKRSSDISLRIPIVGRAESLNVATSAAICLYEVMRQRRSGRSE